MTRYHLRTASIAAAMAFGVLAAGPAFAETFAIKFGAVPGGIFKGHAKVAIPTYHMNFVTSQQATAVSSIAARTRLAMVLSGVDEATMRRLTEEAYADLRKQFEAAGIVLVSEEDARKMVDQSGLARSPTNMFQAGGGAGITIGKSLRRGYVTFGPKAAPAMEAYRGFELAVAAFTGGGGRMAKPAYALDATVVIPSLTIDFAQMSASTGSDLLGRNTASASGNVAFSVLMISPVSLLNPNMINATPGLMRPDKDVTSKTPFATVEEGGAAVRTSATLGAVADENYQMVQRARGDAVVVNLPVWEGLVRDAYRDYNAAIVAAVKKGRG